MQHETDPLARTAVPAGAKGRVRNLFVVALLVGIFLMVPSVQGFGLSAGQDTRAAGSPAQLADELAGKEAERLARLP